MWFVVHFISDDSVEVVPQSWFNNGICAWPKYLKKKEIEKAIKSKMKSNKRDFYFFEARILSQRIGKLYRFR